MKYTFNSLRELIIAHEMDDVARSFVCLSNGPMADSWTQQGWGAIEKQATFAVVGHRRKLWCKLFMEEMFNLWRLMQLRCRPRGKRKFDEVGPVARKHGRTLAHFGTSSSRIPSLQDKSQKMAKKFWDSMVSKQLLVRFDKFKRNNYYPNPHNPKRSPNRSANASVPLTCRLDIYLGFLLMPIVWGEVPPHARS